MHVHRPQEEKKQRNLRRGRLRPPDTARTHGVRFSHPLPAMVSWAWACPCRVRGGEEKPARLVPIPQVSRGDSQPKLWVARGARLRIFGVERQDEVNGIADGDSLQPGKKRRAKKGEAGRRERQAKAESMMLIK